MELVLFEMSKEPGDLADRNLSGHLVHHPAPVHLSQTKKIYIFYLYIYSPDSQERDRGANT